MKKLIGIDIGGTKCVVVDGEYDGKKIIIRNRERFQTLTYISPEKILAKICEIVKKMTGKNIDQYVGIGISCGGPLDNHKGCILSPPNLPGWDKVEIVDFFQNIFNIPVYLENDANAGVLAEWKFGAGRGLSNVIFLTCGTGLGAGMILNNKLYRGMNNMAGEVGHVRLSDFGPVGYGKSGSFEGFCGGSGIAHLAELKIREIKQRGKSHPLIEEKISAQEVFSLAKNGDRLCIEVCEVVGEYLGRGIAMLIDILNPQIIICGSIVARNFSMLVPSIKRVVKRECIAKSAENCIVAPAELFESIGDIAALTVALGVE